MNHEQRNRIEKGKWLLLDHDGRSYSVQIYFRYSLEPCSLFPRKSTTNKKVHLWHLFCFLNTFFHGNILFQKRNHWEGKVDKREEEQKREFGSRNTWWSSKHRMPLLFDPYSRYRTWYTRFPPRSGYYFSLCWSKSNKKRKEVVRIVFHKAQLRVQDTPCHSICSESIA